MRLIADKDGWKRSLLRAGGYDFYHTYDYHQLAATPESRPVLFEFESAAATILLPLLINSGALGNTGFVDAGSVYGYAGPVCTSPSPPSDDLVRFGHELREALLELGVISVFSRLHPLLENASLLRGCGLQREAGRTVSINLLDSPEQQWRGFRDNHRRDIRKLRKAGVSCAASREPRDLDAFIRMYEATMTRRSAAAHYFFPREYFEQMVTAEDFDCRLFVCSQDGALLSGALFCICNGIVQYHLGATSEEFIGMASTKLMFDEVRMWGIAQGYRVLHLGGGLGDADDSLFRFKQGFSRSTHDFMVWNWIIDQRKYDELAALSGHDGSHDAAGFFPVYRSP